GEKTATCPDRRPLAGLSSVLRATILDRSRGQHRECRLRLYVDALARLAGASGLRAGVVRPGRPDVPPRGAGTVQSDAAAHAPGAEPAVSTDAGHRTRLLDHYL